MGGRGASSMTGSMLSNASRQANSGPVGLVDDGGNEVQTSFAEVGREEAARYTAANGWYIDWENQPSDVRIFKVTASGSEEPEGLIGVYDDGERGAAHVTWIVSAPQNQGLSVGSDNKKFRNVAGVLFSKAIDESIKMGYNGDIVSTASNMDLMRLYQSRYGAERIGNTMQFYIGDEAAADIRRRYKWQ